MLPAEIPVAAVAAQDQMATDPMPLVHPAATEALATAVMVPMDAAVRATDLPEHYTVAEVAAAVLVTALIAEAEMELPEQ